MNEHGKSEWGRGGAECRRLRRMLCRVIAVCAATALTPLVAAAQVDTSTPTLTRTPSITRTGTRTRTPTRTRTATRTRTPTRTRTITRTPTSTRVVSPTRTRTGTLTRTPTLTPRSTATPSRTRPPAATVTRTATRTATRTRTPTRTRTATRTRTPTRTLTASRTRTPTRTATRTPTPTATATETATRTPTVPTATFTSTSTPSSTPTPTATRTVTLTPTRGPLCGNDSLDAPEECDDGNIVSNDGCSDACQLEVGGDPCAGVPSVANTTLDSVRVASGLSRPVHVVSAPRDPSRLYIVEATGSMRLMKDGVLQGTPFLSFPPGKVSCCDERGLLGAAFHPNYEDNGYFFLYYTDPNGTLTISRFERNPANPDDALENSEVVLLTVAHPAGNHNGGNLAFGPDGYLYMGLGDGGGGGDPDGNGQNDNVLLGKMLRMDVDNPTPPHKYGIPPSNPRAADGFPLGLIWAKGVRNPWRFSFDRQVGSLYIGEVGQSSREEVDVQPVSSMGGENYGWDTWEGNSCFTAPCSSAGFTFPVLEYSHASGCSITGGYVYRGCSMTNFHGKYFYADFCTAFIRSFVWNGGGGVNTQEDWTADAAPGGGLSISQVSSFGEDGRGELYIVDIGGEVFKFVPGTP